MKEELHQQVEQTLQSLDGLRRADANPFLWSKIKNRMQARTDFMPQGLAWKMVAALALVALLNIMTLYHFQAGRNSIKGPESVANEYAISLPQAY